MRITFGSMQQKKVTIAPKDGGRVESPIRYNVNQSSVESIGATRKKSSTENSPVITEHHRRTPKSKEL